MIPEKMLELLVFMGIEYLTVNNRDVDNWVHENYDEKKINKRYFTLIKEFLNDYALNKTEKSD